MATAATAPIFSAAYYPSPGNLFGLTSGAGDLVMGQAGGGLQTLSAGTSGTVFIYNGSGTGYGGTVTGSPSFAGAVTAGTGFTATTGNITASSGAVSASGNITTSGGNISASAGTVTASGNITSSGGNITASAGTVTASGNITSSGGNISASAGALSASGNITTSAGNISASAGTITASGLIKSTGGNLESATGNIIATEGSITAELNITSNTGSLVALDATNGYVSTAKGLTATEFDIGNTATRTLTSTGDFTIDTGSGNLVLAGGTPTDAQHAVTKSYVDSVATGLDLKASSRAKTVTALASYTGSGTTVLTAAANGALGAIDGVTLLVGDRLLVDQLGAVVAPEDGGIYVVTSLGSAGTPWVLTRATDADTDAEVTSGMFTFVEEGTTAGDKGYVLTTNNPITLGTTPLSFSIFTSQAAAAGSSGYVQYNSGGSFGAEAAFSYNASTNLLSVDKIGKSTTNNLALMGGTSVGGNSASAVLIGDMSTQSTNGDSIALGVGSKVLTARGISMGRDTICDTGNNGTAIGYNSSSHAASGFALGDTATVGSNADRSVSLGYTATTSTNAVAAIAFGDAAVAHSPGSTALGDGASATGNNSAAIGTAAVVSATDALAFGNTATVNSSATQGVALGPNATIATSAVAGLAVGYNATVNSAGGVSIGTACTAAGNDSITIGTGSETSGTEAISIGKNSSAPASAITIGAGSSSTAYSVVIGNASTSITGNYNTALGSGSTAEGNHSLAVMGSTIGDYSLTFGYGSSTTGDYSAALGNEAIVTAGSAVALGDHASAKIANTINIAAIPIARAAVTAYSGASAALASAMTTLMTKDMNVSAATADVGTITIPQGSRFYPMGAIAMSSTWTSGPVTSGTVSLDVGTTSGGNELIDDFIVGTPAEGQARMYWPMPSSSGLGSASGATTIYVSNNTAFSDSGDLFFYRFGLVGLLMEI